jgi:hypothetical protein
MYRVIESRFVFEQFQHNRCFEDGHHRTYSECGPYYTEDTGVVFAGTNLWYLSCMHNGMATLKLKCNARRAASIYLYKYTGLVFDGTNIFSIYAEHSLREHSSACQ